MNGITADGMMGELLVGSGIWDGSQLNITTIASQDLTQFGGFILPGYTPGNNMVLKIWDSSYNSEHEASYELTNGAGTFNGLFSVINNKHLIPSAFSVTAYPLIILISLLNNKFS